jgi:virginiamycin B lyase
MTINLGLNVFVGNGITVGPDRNIWFTASQISPNLELIGRVTTGGTVTFFTDTGGYFPERITSGPDNALWFTEANGTVGRLTTNGRRIRHFTVGPSNAVLGGIVTGPDGNLWVTAFEAGSGFGNKVYRLTPQGEVTSYTVGSGPDSICVGPDNALWFTEYRANAIGRITRTGKLTQFPTGQPYGEPSGIVTGPDNALWFTDFAGRFGIGRIRRDGKMTFTRVPHRRRFPPELNDIIVGPDNAMWFTSEIDPSAVGRISPN